MERRGPQPGREVFIALDPAASEFFRDGRYELTGEGRTLRAQEMVELWESWVDRYPVISIEDGLAEDDWDGWRLLTARPGRRVQLGGDHTFVTNAARPRHGSGDGIATRILIT